MSPKFPANAELSAGTLKNIVRKSKYYVYILQCNDGTYYTGYTNNLKNRIELHNAGCGAKYLRGKGPVKLVYAKSYRSRKYAMRAEQNIKKLPRERKQEFMR